MTTSPDPTSRRVGSRGVPREVREAEILEVAGEAFAESGFHGTSMDDIAARADVSKPLLYQYFGSKEGLYLAYADAAGRRLAEEITRAADAEGGVDERLWAGILAFFRFVDEHRVGWTVLYQEAASQGGPFAAEVAELRSRLIGTIAALVDQASGDLGAELEEPAGAASLAHAVVGAGESLANWWLERSDVPLEEVARRLMDLAWIGLRDLAAGERWRPPGPG